MTCHVARIFPLPPLVRRISSADHWCTLAPSFFDDSSPCYAFHTAAQRSVQTHEHDEIPRREQRVLMLPRSDGDDGDDIRSTAETAESTNGEKGKKRKERKKKKRTSRVLLELFVPDPATAQAWVQRAGLQEELFFGKASAQPRIPLARLSSYPAEDIANSMATNFQTARGGPIPSVRYSSLCSA